MKKKYVSEKWSSYKHGVGEQSMIEVKQLCWNVISFLPGQLQNFTLLIGKCLQYFITQGKYHIFVKFEQVSKLLNCEIETKSSIKSSWVMTEN